MERKMENELDTGVYIYTYMYIYMGVSSKNNTQSFNRTLVIRYSGGLVELQPRTSPNNAGDQRNRTCLLRNPAHCLTTWSVKGT